MKTPLVRRRLFATVMLAIAGVFGVFAAACSATSPDQAGGGLSPELTQLPRALAPSESMIAAAANDFSFSLFRTINSTQAGANVFTSPLSASMALGMAMNGAAGATYDQMRQTLGFGTATESDINAGYKNLVTLLRGLDPAVELRIANSVWYRAGYPFTQSFLDASRGSFDARVTGLNFADPAALDAINGWVSTATNGRITRVLDEITPDQMMFLINAIYFKGSWRERFDASLTRDETFRAVTAPQTVRMMHRRGTMSYAATADYEAVDLPYGNGAFTMTVLLPREGKSVETLASSLQASGWSALAAQLHSATVDLALPKFKVEWKRTLNPDLKALGMRDAFDAAADFSRLSSRGRELIIDFVKQNSYVDVNEEGTEAAAVTVVGFSAVSAPAMIPVHVDRPFVFVIREHLSGTVLFMGKIVRIP